MRGSVVSNKMTGVVAVLVESIKIHPIYKKRLKRSKKFLAQTKEGLNIGDVVEITETRPISKRVRFNVTKIYARVEALPQVRSEEVKPEKKVPAEVKATSAKVTKVKVAKREVKS